MLPITLLAAQSVSSLLTNGNALQEQISAIAASCNVNVPPITSSQVVLSSGSQALDDLNLQMTYPRICLYTSGLNNTQIEKFRSLSGIISVVAEVLASGNLATETDQWIHFYVEAMTDIMRQNIGDWGNGLFFGGRYEVHFESPRSGGLGFSQSATASFHLNVSLN